MIWISMSSSKPGQRFSLVLRIIFMSHYSPGSLVLSKKPFFIAYTENYSWSAFKALINALASSAVSTIKEPLKRSLQSYTAEEIGLLALILLSIYCWSFTRALDIPFISAILNALNFTPVVICLILCSTLFLRSLQVKIRSSRFIESRLNLEFHDESSVFSDGLSIENSDLIVSSPAD